MGGNPKPLAALGLRVKSGWATVVMLAGSPVSPSVLDCRRIELSDPAVPRSRQPYHRDFGTAESNEKTISRLVRVVERHSHKTITQLVGHYTSTGRVLAGAGLVVGSDVDPKTIGNPHIRAHAAEGRLFRTVVEGELRRCGLRTFVFLERHLYLAAAQGLGRQEPDVKRAVAQLPRAARSPWRVDEKAAAAAAWLVLATPRAPAKTGRRRKTVA